MKMKPMKNLVCFGDSITHGAALKKRERWTSCLQKMLDSRCPKGVTVYNAGVGGNTTAMGIDRISRDVVPLLPGLVLIEFGFNDGYVLPWSQLPRLSLSEYRRNLVEIIRIIRQHKGQVIVIRNHTQVCNHPQGNGRSFAKNFAPFDRALRDLCQKDRLPMIDLPRFMKSRGLTPADLVTEDGLHLSVQGNQHYAAMVCAGLEELVNFSNG